MAIWGEKERMTTNFDDPFWNLAQLLAWTMFRDKELVHRASDNTHDHGTHWEEMTVPGEDGKPEKRMVEIENKRPSAATIALVEGFRKAHSDYIALTYGEATSEILRKLQIGELKGHGFRNGGGNLIEIPALEWAELKFTSDPDRAMQKEFSHTGYWSKLKFERRQVLNIWPESKSTKKTAKDKTQCYDWLLELMKNGSPEKSKPRYLEEAQEKFKISERSFNDVWKNAAKASGNNKWISAGRKTKQK